MLDVCRTQKPNDATAPASATPSAHRLARAPARQQGDRQQQQRPDHIELFLHCQRPVMLHKGRLLINLEIAGAGVGEVDVGDEAYTPSDVDDGVVRPFAEERSGRRSRWPAALRRRPAGYGEPSEIEALDRKAAGALDLIRDQTGDREPLDGEEDVDSDESAVGPDP